MTTFDVNAYTTTTQERVNREFTNEKKLLARVDGVDKSGKTHNDQGARLEILFNELKRKLSEEQEKFLDNPCNTFLTNAIERAERKIKIINILKDELFDYKKFSKENRFSVTDLTQIANGEKSIEDLFDLVQGIAKPKQPEKSMCNLITIPQEQKPHKISQQYLVSSAPKQDEEVTTFWDNVLKSDSRTIVSVLQAQEGNKIKSVPYWDTDSFKLENITKVGEEVLQSGVKETSLIRRTFQVTKDDNTPYEIQQFHYEGWPDHNIAPDRPLFSRLLQEVRIRDEGIHPITVHCAGGVGRSSAFVFSYSLYKKMLEKSISSKSRSEVPDENQHMETISEISVRNNFTAEEHNEETKALESDEPKYNLLKYMFEGMSQRKSFGTKKHISNVAAGALDAFNATQANLV